MSDMDWGGGDWWEIWPPPPGEDDEGVSGASDDADFPEDVPPAPDYPDFDSLWAYGGSLPEEIYNAFQYLEPLENVDIRNIRGTAFQTVYEAYDWLQSVGLLGISKIVQQGNFYYPVVGEYDDDDEPAPDYPEDDDYGPEPILLDW